MRALRYCSTHFFKSGGSRFLTISSARVSTRTIRLVFDLVSLSCQENGIGTLSVEENRSSMRMHSIPLALKHKSVNLSKPAAIRNRLIDSHVGWQWYSCDSC